jgi:hypothetical protein
MSAEGLEQQRRAILDRMQLRRDNYRRMLQENAPLEHLPDGEDLAPHVVTDAGVVAPLVAVPDIPEAPDTFPRSALMRVVSNHPIYWALGIATVVALGPRRIGRTVSKGANSVANATVRNSTAVDLLSGLLSLAGAYMRGRSGRRRR